jgi:hypothetical protein
MGEGFSWLMKCTQIDIGYKRDSQHGGKTPTPWFKKRDITERLFHEDIPPFNKTVAVYRLFQ